MTALRLDREPGWRIWLLLFIALAFAFRWASFGNPALHTDEEFYFLVGQRMLDGQLPYVDIWDRKPFGLFLIYAGFAVISRSVIAYQAAAALSAGITAAILGRIVPGRWPGKLVAGTGYLILLLGSGGHGGQSPLFYNLPMALAALMVVRALPDLEAGRVPRNVTAAMLLCGLAITIKQTVAFESLIFGLFSLGLARQRGAPLPLIALSLLRFAVAGLLPFAATGLFYWLNGHAGEWWQAMVTSNFAKQHYGGEDLTRNLNLLIRPNLIPLLLAAGGLIAMPSSSLRLFLGTWLVAAIAALFAVPNFYYHYALPVLLPISCLVGCLFARFPRALPMAVLLGAWGLWQWHAFDRSWHERSRSESQALASAILARDPGRTLLVYDGPVYLYALTGARPLSRLVLPWHFRERIEANASGRPANAELAELLDRRPGAVTLAHWSYMTDLENRKGRAMVEAWVATHCENAGIYQVTENRMRFPVTLYAPCK